MTTELEAAIERVKRVRDGESPCPWFTVDCVRLASAHIAHLEAEAERKRERAEPVTAEWLNTRFPWLMDFDFHEAFEQFFEFPSGAKEGDPLPRTKGQVLDLLAALRGEA